MNTYRVSKARLNSNKINKVEWEYSKEYSNVIIVKTWRKNKMNEKEEEKIKAQLYPTWRRYMLNTHSVITGVANFVARPFVWIGEQFNGTAELRAELKRMEEDERKVAEADTLEP